MGLIERAGIPQCDNCGCPLGAPSDVQPIVRAYPAEEITRDPIFLLQRRLNGEHWHTESVWFTRAEAEAYGEAHAYNYGRGWRVYCTCAEGILARLLKAHTS